MTDRLGFLSRRGLLDKKIDDFREMFPTWITAVPLKGGMAKEIEVVGKAYGLKLETFYVGRMERYVVFATNGRGFRTHLLTVESETKGFATLGSDTADKVREILYWNRNQVKFFSEVRRKKVELERVKNEKLLKELEYTISQYRGVFRRMARLLGAESGKTRFPYGASSVGRF